jgi:FAD-linked sulfhydryl oxidase
MNPKFWGPGAWIFLHSITMNYPKEPSDDDKQVYYNFFKNLENVIPCEKCGYNYSMNIQKYPVEPALSSRDLLIRWLIKIHNEVNKETGKREYTYDEVIEEYKYKMNHVDSDPTLVYKIIIIGLLIVLIYKYGK